ncbi:siderophore-iron reductase FhuF [Mesorhizobium sp. CGMCC 1.15528]|uniref:Siderophore-iron reductase FhuF n=1 Tax=Mesorhizobium zhangyense TaxID=1776730 RepID=A0A7C9VFI4_9HYPH|nr:siderophore-iron reductase FhuF [Mesorhizobium zhangyense]NGN43510.1 siderophore-iron reductase FhuF [Mesorhizobium zhangyense]
MAALGEQLVLQDDPRPYVPGADLLDERRLGALLARFAENYEQPDLPAVATQWSKWHFSVLLAPVLAANIIADWQLPTDLETIGVILSENSRTSAIRLSGEGSAVRPADAHERFGVLIERHLKPIIAALSHASGLPQKVLWSNAGNVAENVMRECETFLGAGHAGVQHGNLLFASRNWPDGSRNWLYQPVRYVKKGDEIHRQRRVCCLRYSIRSLAYCKSCPLDVPRSRGAE